MKSHEHTFNIGFEEVLVSASNFPSESPILHEKGREKPYLAIQQHKKQWIQNFEST